MTTHQAKIEKLIAELCPHGVEFRRLGDVSEIKRGTSITKKNIINGDIPVVAGGKKPAYYHNESNRSGQTIVIAGSGAYAGFVSWWEKPIFVSDAFTVKPNNELLAKYCFYFLKNLQQQIHDLKSGGGVPHVYPRNVAPLQIPIPPLIIQKEIVRILDKFTTLTTELTTELTARKKQYSYYRDQLLTFSDDAVAWVPLREIFNLKNGYTPSKSEKDFWQNGSVPWFRMDDIRQNGQILDNSLQKISKSAVKGGKLFPADSIIIATSATIGEHALITVPYLANQRFTNLSLKEKYVAKLDIKFIFYYCFLLGEWCRKNTTMSSFASVDMDGFRKFKIPIPHPDDPKKSLAKQARIVSILDKFDTLTHSISEGLPREIALRQKQYEYYRDLLLNFPQFPSLGGVAGEA